MKEQIKNTSVYDTSIRLMILAFIIAWCIMILLPFVSIMLWGLILGIAFKPLHDKMIKLMGGKAKLSSFIIVLVCLAIFIIPGWLLLDSIIENVKDLKASFQAGTLTLPAPSEKVKSWPVFGEKLYDLWYSASTNLEQTIIKYKSELTGIGSKLARGLISVGGGIFQLLISIIIAGVLLVIPGIGESIRKFFMKLAGDRGDEFADITRKTIGNVVKGVLGVAVIQAALIGVGFFLAEVPYAGVWTLLVFLLAGLQIPPTLVVIPIAIYLFSAKETVPAILWTIYLLLGGLSDNILKPILLGKGAPVPMLVIFLGVVGGFILSGFIGLFTGAIVMSIGYKLFVAWINSVKTEESTVKE
jgi:predicted PurR-regulated permease PerM